MLVFAYDDRIIMPDYVIPFIWNTTQFCDLHLITPAKKMWGMTKPTATALKHRVHVVHPSDLPGYPHVRQLFDNLFVNYSTTPAVFERTCFHRWFALNALTTNLGDDEYICLLDTDFLIGMHPSEVLSRCLSKTENRNIQFIAEWAGDKPTAVGPEISIMTKSYLYGFCKYLLTTYYSPYMRNLLLGEYFDRIGNGLPGGVCDMSALAAYKRLHGDDSFNLRKLDEPKIIENFNSFLSADVGTTDSWKISFQSGKQTLQVANESRKLIGIHFQGDAKALMHLACEDKSEITRSTCVEQLGKEQKFYRKITEKLKRVINRFTQIATDFRWQSNQTRKYRL